MVKPMNVTTSTTDLFHFPSKWVPVRSGYFTTLVAMNGLSVLSTVIVTRMALIVLFAVTTVRATPLRVPVVPRSPVVASVHTTTPIAVGRSVHPGIQFYSRFNNDGGCCSHARR